MSIATLWQRLETWAERNAPEMLDELQGPATQVELEELEKRLQRTLPEDFKQSLLIHNGEDDGWPARVFEHGAYLPVPGIYAQWKHLNFVAGEQEYVADDDEPVDQRIKPAFFREDWIPITDMNGDVIHAIDLDPGEGGVVGQIIHLDWEADVCEVVADSFTDFLEQYVQALEAGKIRIELEKSGKHHSGKSLEAVGIDEYFTDDATETYQNYQKQLKYVEGKTKQPDMEESDFNDGDVVTLYGTIEPNHESRVHKFNAFYVGTIPIQGNLEVLKGAKGPLSHHVFAVDLKVSLKKYFLIHVRKYTIQGFRELDPNQ